MQINLDKNFYIGIDEYNHTLHMKFIGKTREGEKRQSDKVIGYYGSIDDCLEAYLDARQNHLTVERAVSLREYVNLVTKSNKEALRAFKRLIKESTC
ncbi:MAG: hypothetical protein HFE64_03265 [Lachnospiraceae bacterium]|jgi:hypothetical protein|nr:hypothetical protein [Lachnospiraceae bacterium]